MWTRMILLVICCLRMSVSYADTTVPKVVFNNGVTASVNYSNEEMDQKNRLGFIFDNDPKTIWYFPTKNKSAVLTIRNKDAGIIGAKLNISCNANQQVLFKTETSNNIKIIHNGSYLSADFDDTHELKITLSGSEICINDLVLDLHDGRKGTAFIEETGGGYPDVYLYSQEKWAEHFKPGNVASYFLKNGKYAVFVLNADIGPLGGIRIINLNTLKSVDYLKGEFLDFDSIKWNGAEVSGVVDKLNENWRKESFKINVVFP
jgi:hypothetical protein